jgi:hypothetical protein
MQLAGVVNFTLPAGNYWLGIAPVSGQAQLLSTTTGLDAGPPGDPNPAPTGSPRANGNSFLNDAVAGYNWLPTSDSLLLGEGTWDFSYGVEGVPVPEPSTFIAGALLAFPFGLQGFRYFRNRRRA